MRVVIPLLLLASVSFADSSVDQAYQRLQERERQRQAAATQPARITNAQLDSLRKELDHLRKQVADLLSETKTLKAENAELQQKLAEAKEPELSGDEAINKAFQENRIVVGMTEDQVTAIMGRTKLSLVDEHVTQTLAGDKPATRKEWRISRGYLSHLLFINGKLVKMED